MRRVECVFVTRCGGTKIVELPDPPPRHWVVPLYDISDNSLMFHPDGVPIDKFATISREDRRFEMQGRYPDGRFCYSEGGAYLRTFPQPPDAARWNVRLVDEGFAHDRYALDVGFLSVWIDVSHDLHEYCPNVEDEIAHSLADLATHAIANALKSGCIDGGKPWLRDS